MVKCYCNVTLCYQYHSTGMLAVKLLRDLSEQSVMPVKAYLISYINTNSYIFIDLNLA